jgi:hypothetical protein
MGCATPVATSKVHLKDRCVTKNLALWSKALACRVAVLQAAEGVAPGLEHVGREECQGAS